MGKQTEDDEVVEAEIVEVDPPPDPFDYTIPRPNPHPRFTKVEHTAEAIWGIFASPEKQDEVLGPFKKLFFGEDE